MKANDPFTRTQRAILILLACEDKNGIRHSPDKFDILIRYNATATKRNEPQTGMRMLDHLSQIDKTHWIIREPRAGDIWQWTFLLGLNWGGLNDWKSQGFLYAITPNGIVPEAADIINKLNYTKDERMTLGGWQ